MNFQGLGKIESYQTYLDMAFKNGVQAAMASRSQVKAQTKKEKSRKIEMTRITAISRSLVNSLNTLVKKFPDIDSLDQFYVELIRCTLDYDNLKRSLGALMWARRQIQEIERMHIRKIKGTRQLEMINKTRTAFSGRVSSFMKQIGKNLQYLDYARKTMKSFPSIKTGRDTIVIAGSPNVGKSTLLAVLTGSKPEVAHYPFTTKTLNLGYDAKKRQYIDTPGLLDRPLQERNTIEKQAILALKHVAKLIIFVIDPTESCGYSVPEQRHLLIEIKNMFKLPIIVASNKSDTGAKFKNAILISAKEGIGIDELKDEIDKLLKN